MTTNYELKLGERKVETNHFKAFKVKFLGATNYRGSRVKITDTRMGKSVTIPYNYKFNNIKEIAFDYLNSKGLEIEGFSWDEKGQFYNILTKDFEFTLDKKEKKFYWNKQIIKNFKSSVINDRATKEELINQITLFVKNEVGVVFPVGKDHEGLFEFKENVNEKTLINDIINQVYSTGRV